MARKASPKSATAKPLAPRIGEYVQRASEVAKLSKTLQEQIVAVSHAFQDYNSYTTENENNHNHEYHKETELWRILSDARTEADKALSEIWDALAGLYDAMTSQPVGFKEVAAALRGVVSAVKGISERGISRVPDIEGVLFFLSPLHIATNQLHTAVHELTQCLFHSIPSSLPDDDESDKRVTKRMERLIALGAQYGVTVAVRGTAWQQVLRVLQAKEPDAPEWEDITDEDSDSVEQACWLYLERKDEEHLDAENDANYRQLMEALQAALPPLTPQPGETKEQTAKKVDVRLRIAVYLLELAKSDIQSGFKSSHIDKAVAIIDGTDTVKNKMLALEQQIPIFAKLTDSARAPSRVVANLLGCTHPAVLDARKLLQSGDAEVTRAERQGRGIPDGDIDGTSKKAASGREDFNEEEYSDSVDIAADKLSVVGKDTVRKGARSKKHDPDAKLDRETNKWIEEHGG